MKKAVPCAILTVYLLASALQIIRIVYSVRETRQLDYGEGIVLWQASQVFNLKSAFHPLQQYPHIVFHYTPVYHIALRAAATLVGDPLLSGRLVSMAAAFWLVGLFVWAVLNATRGYAPAGIRRFGAAFAGACALLVPVMKWAPLARVDMLGLALQFTALSAVCSRPSRLRNQITAFCLLLLGLYTKQSLLAVPSATILLLGLIHPVRAAWLTGALAVAGLAILLILARATEGGVIRHWILYNVNPFSLKNALYFEQIVSTNVAALIATGLAGAWLTLPRLKGLRTSPRTISARLAASRLRRTGTGFGLVAAFGFIVSWGIGKDGANFNYCLDWQFALCPLSGIFIVLLSRSWQSEDRGMALLRPVIAVLLGATGLQLGVQAMKDCNWAAGWVGFDRQMVAGARRDDAELIRLISMFPGPVVSENMTALLRAGKSIPFEPAIIRQTTDTGVFDENPLVRKTTEGFFDAFVFFNDPTNHFFSPRMLDAIHRHYKPYPLTGPTYLMYVRRQP